MNSRTLKEMMSILTLLYVFFLPPLSYTYLIFIVSENELYVFGNISNLYNFPDPFLPLPSPFLGYLKLHGSVKSMSKTNFMTWNAIYLELTKFFLFAPSLRCLNFFSSFESVSTLNFSTLQNLRNDTPISNQQFFFLSDPRPLLSCFNFYVS